MERITNGVERLAWSKPEVRRMTAGSAEAAARSGSPDAGGGSNGKNFS